VELAKMPLDWTSKTHGLKDFKRGPMNKGHLDRILKMDYIWDLTLKQKGYL